MVAVRGPRATVEKRHRRSSIVPVCCSTSCRRRSTSQCTIGARRGVGALRFDHESLTRWCGDAAHGNGAAPRPPSDGDRRPAEAGQAKMGTADLPVVHPHSGSRRARQLSNWLGPATSHLLRRPGRGHAQPGVPTPLNRRGFRPGTPRSSLAPRPEPVSRHGQLPDDPPCADQRGHGCEIVRVTYEGGKALSVNACGRPAVRVNR